MKTALAALAAMLAIGCTKDLPYQAPKADWSPLHLAVLHHDLNKARHLLDKGADVNKTSKGEPTEFGERIDRNLTPLHLAARLGDEDMERLLLSKGAKVDSREGMGRTPLITAVQQKNDRASLLLIKSGADVRLADNDGLTALHDVSSDVLANELIAKGADVNAPSRDTFDREYEVSGETPLHFARSAKIAELLVSHGASIDGLDSRQRSPLIASIFHEHPDVALFLISKGAKVDTQDSLGETALTLASRNSESAVVASLIDHHANISSRDSDNKTPLALALENVDDPDIDKAINADYAKWTKAREPHTMVEYLLDHGADPNEGSGDRNAPPLVIAAMLGDDPRVIEELLKHGAKIDATDSLGMSAVHWAAENLHPRTLRILIAHHANVNLRDKRWEDTPRPGKHSSKGCDRGPQWSAPST